MKITQKTETEYQVLSDSGKTYTVKYCGSGDGDGDPEYCALWECDCPSNKYRGTCKHINAVSSFIDDEENN